MSDMWNFSPSLQDKLRLCIAAARTEENNKWVKQFGHVKYESKHATTIETKSVVNLCNSQELIANIAQINHKEVHEVKQELKTELSGDLDAKNIEEWTESLESDFQSNIDFIIKECLRNQLLLPLLAMRLSTPTVEKMCSHIYDRKDLKKEFVKKFFEEFLPVFLKCEYNSSTLDILVRGNKTYPLEFRELLKIIVKDVEIPTKVLQDYVSTLNENTRSEFIIDLAESDLSQEEFVNNLFTIYVAYKGCPKTEQIQNYVQSMLSQYSTFCVTDRNYGRLFLAYLQAQKCMKNPVNYEILAKLLEDHRSPFKRPCLTLIRELCSVDDGNMSTSDEDSE